LEAPLLNKNKKLLKPKKIKQKKGRRRFLKGGNTAGEGVPQKKNMGSVQVKNKKGSKKIHERGVKEKSGYGGVKPIKRELLSRFKG